LRSYRANSAIIQQPPLPVLRADAKELERQNKQFKQ